MEDQVQIITIPVHTGLDPAVLLEIAIALADNIEDAIESYGEESTVLEEEISVEDGDDLHGGE